MGTNGQNTTTLQSFICLLSLADATGLGEAKLPMGYAQSQRDLEPNISSIKETGTCLLACGTWVGSGII